MNESPFKLAFSTYAIILVEIGLPIMRVEYYEEPSNLDYLRANLDLLKETQHQAYLRMATY